MTTIPSPWTPATWRARPITQQPSYADEAELARVLAEIRTLPPLVFRGEVDNLRVQLGEAAAGRRFVLQGGDCAERFLDCNPTSILNKLKILMQMSLVLTHGARRPVVRIGRMAGQFAKPRSRPTEAVEGVELPSYRGDNVNGYEPTLAARTPAPARLREAYFHSAATLNFARALVDGGFGDLHHPEHWSLEFMADESRRADYQDITSRILDALDFLDTIGGVAAGLLTSVDFFTSHEGLLLAYEEALTHAEANAHYNHGAHFLWIGDRTRALDGAHVEYFRGIANPIGVKVGPALDARELVGLCRALDPERTPGRLTLITRYGRDRIEQRLPEHLRAVIGAGWQPLWMCDPMHGNGVVTEQGVKTRHFDAIVGELERAFELHAAHGSRLGGVHFELTGEDVTECVGGPQELRSHELSRNYETYCDPRLNYAQSLEMAFLIASRLRSTSGPR